MRWLSRRVLVVAVFLLPAVVSAMEKTDPLSVGVSPFAIDHLDRAMTALVDGGDRAGVVWAVAKDGKLLTHKAAGMRNVAEGLPMETDSLFRYYSMTRAVTAVAVMMMYEEGKFALDDPVAKYIPAFADTPVIVDRTGDQTVTEPQASPMTVYHLLTYTSGLGYTFDYQPVHDVTFENTLYPGMTIEEGVAKLAATPLLFQPGKHWYYGFSGDVLGRLVEIWSGHTYNEFLEQRIFAPLGLDSMGFHIADEDWHKLAVVYAKDEDGNLVDALDRTPVINSYREGDTIFSGGGGLAGNTIDYLRLAQMLLNGGELDGVRLLKPETVALMTRNHLTPEQGPINWYAQGRFTESDPWTRQNGYGWGLSIGVRLDDGDHTVTGGRGEFKWDGLANTTFFVDPEHKIVAVAMTQYLGTDQDDLEMNLRSALYGGLLESSQ